MITKLTTEIKLAMKARDSVRLTTLRCVMSDAKNIAIADKRKDTTSADVVVAVTKGIKQRKDSHESYVSAGRTDLADIEKIEMDILTEFQPKQLTELDIAEIVDDIIKTIQMPTKKDMGKVMGIVMQKIEKGTADGKLISKIVGSKLK